MKSVKEIRMTAEDRLYGSICTYVYVYDMIYICVCMKSVKEIRMKAEDRLCVRACVRAYVRACVRACVRAYVRAKPYTLRPTP